MTLTIHGSPATNVFRLAGADENSATFALGWVLERSEHLRTKLLNAWFGTQVDAPDAIIALQKYGDDRGYTDIEVHAGKRFHAIIEAKGSWDLPTEEQLRRYRPRLGSRGAKHQRLITITSASVDFAKRWLPSEIDGAVIVHQSWTDIQRLARLAHGEATHFEEKLWLKYLSEHLQEFVAMERIMDNRVFVVSLGRDAMVEGGSHTWIDVVEKDRCYFHPMGGSGWPVQPPNYIGFRYQGKLQSVHHIDVSEAAQDLSTLNPLWPKSDGFNFVYHLGPPMRPTTEVRTGNIFRNGRVYCAIDTLLSGAFKTISDARDETTRRLNKALQSLDD